MSLTRSRQLQEARREEAHQTSGQKAAAWLQAPSLLWELWTDPNCPQLPCWHSNIRAPPYHTYSDEKDGSASCNTCKMMGKEAGFASLCFTFSGSVLPFIYLETEMLPFYLQHREQHFQMMVPPSPLKTRLRDLEPLQ